MARCEPLVLHGHGTDNTSLTDEATSYHVAGQLWDVTRQTCSFSPLRYADKNDLRMAKRPGTEDGMVTSPTVLRNFAADLSIGDVNMDCSDGAEELSLEEILALYSQPINEEQAWAVCYQCCRTLAQKHRRRSSKSAVVSSAEHPRRIEGPGNVRLGRDGTVKLHFEDNAGN